MQYLPETFDINQRNDQGQSALRIAFEHHTIQHARPLHLQHLDFYSAYLVPIHGNYLQIVARFLKEPNLDVNEYRHQKFYLNYFYNDPAILEYFLSHPAFDSSHVNETGNSMLHSACGKCDGDLHYWNDDIQSLSIKSTKYIVIKSTLLISMLAYHSPNQINQKNNAGQTPLEIAYHSERWCASKLHTLLQLNNLDISKLSTKILTNIILKLLADNYCIQSTILPKHPEYKRAYQNAVILIENAKAKTLKEFEKVSISKRYNPTLFCEDIEKQIDSSLETMSCVIS